MLKRPFKILYQRRFIFPFLSRYSKSIFSEQRYMSIMYAHTCLIGKIITQQWDVMCRIKLCYTFGRGSRQRACYGKSRFALLAFGTLSTNREEQVAILTNTSMISFFTKTLH